MTKENSKTSKHEKYYQFIKKENQSILRSDVKGLSNVYRKWVLNLFYSFEEFPYKLHNTHLNYCTIASLEFFSIEFKIYFGFRNLESQN